MFTGIVQTVGVVAEVSGSGEGSTLGIRAPQIVAELHNGQSVSVDGVCLTVIELQGEVFRVEATPETLRRTNLGRRRLGDRVNLETAARLGDFLGGHLVQGHVDGTGTVLLIREDGNSRILRFSIPPEIRRHAILKGSVAVNGVSLTISGLGEEWFEVSVIPHTWKVTNLSALELGEDVNVEVDLISKYVESHLRRGVVTLVLLFAFCLSLNASTFNLTRDSVLVYENTAGGKTSQFVLRVARFHPDIFLEWETPNHQGTLHLYQNAVHKGQRFSLSQLFEVGVDMESKDVMTIWLSGWMFDRLSEKQTARIYLNNLPVKITLEGEEEVSISVDQEIVTLSVIRLRDERNGTWIFNNDPRNPILIEYSSPYFMKRLQSVSHRSNSLRWIRRLPPVK